jgi:DNA invertase Pin-like site-specific DNA recombinase
MAYVREGDTVVVWKLHRLCRTPSTSLKRGRHIAVVCGDEENLGVGFTRSASLPVIRDTLKQIEEKWAS